MIFKVNSMDIPYKFLIKVIIKAIIRMDLFHNKVVKILFNANKVYVVLRVVIIILILTIAMILIFSHLIMIIDIVLIIKHYYHYKILNNI